MDMGIIKVKDLIYEYIRRDEEGNVEGITTAVDNVSLDIRQGDFVAVLGHNGSGKSTLAKHLNAILYPTEGTVWVDGKDTRDDTAVWDIRQTAGMVFQNPDNQIIGQVVEEDVGFGPENMGVPTKEIWERVEESLKAVGMYQFRKFSPNKLSGGQKQRVSIAGVIAMHPKCIVLDEPTAMLDPKGRKEVIRAVRALNDVERITVILITHYMEEVIYADRVYVMDQGKITLQGDTAGSVFRGGTAKGAAARCAAGDTVGSRTAKRGISHAERGAHKSGICGCAGSMRQRDGSVGYARAMNKRRR